MSLALAWLVAMGPAITWEAPAGCPDALAVAQQVDALLHGSTTNYATLRAEARVELHDGRFRLELVLRDDRQATVERRELEAVECASLAQALALIVAVHVDAVQADTNAVALQRPHASPLAAVVVQEPTVLAPRIPDTIPSPRASTPTLRRIDGLLRFEGSVDAGILPGVGGGAGVMGGVTSRTWRAELGAGGWPARSASANGVGTRLDLVVGRARVCWAPTIGRWSVPVCGGGELGGLRGIGTVGVGQPIARWAPWAAVTASLGAMWSIRPRIGPYVALDGVAALSRPRFSVGPQPVFQTTAVGVRGWLGLELKFASRARPRTKT